MNKIAKIIPLLLILVCSTVVTRAADDAKDKEEGTGRLQRAATALENLTNAPDRGIPQEVFDSAKCIAVVPNLTKGGFVFGAARGRGVASCRLATGQWSAPAFFTITGGSWGAQIGVEDVHLVIMIMNEEGMRHLLSDKFQVGADASASAGPVGRHAAAGTDWKAQTEMLTYSRSKGLFAGIDLAGSWINSDMDLNHGFYGRAATTRELLSGEVPAPSEARAFLDEIRRVKEEARQQ